MDKTEFEKMLERKVAEEATAKHVRQADDTNEDIPPSGAENDSAETDAIAPSNDASTETSALDLLRQQLEERSSECEQLKEQMLRARADFDNYRKRTLREMDQLRQTAAANLIRSLLPALDNLERALAHAEPGDGLAEGVGMVFKQLQDILAAEGLEPLEAAGAVFDPNIHDALATTPSDTVEQGRIVQEYERGYRLKDTVLRPARVIVSSGPPEQNTPSGSETDNNAEKPSTE